jgi:hypothetical protein
MLKNNVFQDIKGAKNGLKSRVNKSIVIRGR